MGSKLEDQKEADSATHKERMEQEKRGRKANWLWGIPLKGWRDILLRVKAKLGKDHIGLVSAGVAFYAFLAVFPALIAVIMIYGLAADPVNAPRQIDVLSEGLPEQVREMLKGQVSTIAGHTSKALSWGLVFSVGVAIWSANKGVRALFLGLQIAYDEEDRRGFLLQNALTLLFTLGGIVGLCIAVTLVPVLPIVLQALGMPRFTQTLLTVARWPVLGAMVMLTLAVLYRWGPQRANARWHWVSAGAVVATLLWLAASWGFSFYVRNFGRFNKTYGSLAAVIILMLWFMLSSFMVLLGAEINAESEGQTGRDTTAGPPKPLGQRGAYHADHVAKSP